jgi:hypothetical protein
LLAPVANGRVDQKIRSLELLTEYVSVLREKVTHTQAQLTAPAAPAVPDQLPDNTGAGGIVAPPGPAPQAAPIDPAVARASIQNMLGLINSFSSTIRSALRDQSPIVSYWAQAELARLGDRQSRLNTALKMIQGKDWEQRMLGLMVANDLPVAQGMSVAQKLTGDPVSYVSDFAKATIEVGNLPPTTRPATPPTTPQ